MGIIDHIYLAILYLFSEYDNTPFFGFVIAFTVAGLNMWKHKKFKMAEALLCGVFAAIASVSTQFLGVALGLTLPVGAYAIIAGAIGWFGTDAVVDFLKSRFNWGGQK